MSKLLVHSAYVMLSLYQTMEKDETPPPNIVSPPGSTNSNMAQNQILGPFDTVDNLTPRTI